MTLEQFQSIIAKRYNLGDKLVTGHKKKYFDEAAREYTLHLVDVLQKIQGINLDNILTEDQFDQIRKRIQIQTITEDE